VFIVVSIYFVIDSVRKLLDTPSYSTRASEGKRQEAVKYDHELRGYINCYGYLVPWFSWKYTFLKRQ